MRQFHAFRQSFDPQLQAFVEQKLASYAPIATDAFVETILEYAKNITFKGGKRVRPYLASIGFAAAKGRRASSSVLPVFMALELFHVFALIHDDIMDQGMSRHGIPTTHIFVTQALQKNKRVGDIKRSGESQAILLGDLLFS
jgi:geranylgeranyl diphosphate synthase type I